MPTEYIQAHREREKETLSVCVLAPRNLYCAKNVWTNAILARLSFVIQALSRQMGAIQPSNRLKIEYKPWQHSQYDTYDRSYLNWPLTNALIIINAY